MTLSSWGHARPGPSSASSRTRSTGGRGWSTESRGRRTCRSIRPGPAGRLQCEGAWAALGAAMVPCPTPRPAPAGSAAVMRRSLHLGSLLRAAGLEVGGLAGGAGGADDVLGAAGVRGQDAQRCREASADMMGGEVWGLMLSRHIACRLVGGALHMSGLRCVKLTCAAFWAQLTKSAGGRDAHWLPTTMGCWGQDASGMPCRASKREGPARRGYSCCLRRACCCGCCTRMWGPSALSALHAAWIAPVQPSGHSTTENRWDPAIHSRCP